MPFALHEYDAAFSRFFSQSMRVAAQAQSPLLAQTTFVEMPGTVASLVRDREGLEVELPESETSTEVTADLKAVRHGDYEQLYEAMYESADALAEQLVGYFVDTIGKVTEGTGDVVDAGGRGFGFEVLYESLSRMDFALDEDGELVMPTLVMNPADYEKIRDLPELTADQQRLLDELKARKKEEALARRRRRRLS